MGAEKCLGNDIFPEPIMNWDTQGTIAQRDADKAKKWAPMRHIVSVEAFYTVRLIKHKMNADISLGASAEHANEEIEKHNEGRLYKTNKIPIKIIGICVIINY